MNAIRSKNIFSAATLLFFFVLEAKAEVNLVAEGAKVEKLAGDFKFTEGPAADAKGNVYFSDIPNARIHVWSVDGKLSIFRENSGGSNGNHFDRKGNLISCEGSARRVTSGDMSGNVAVVAERYNGKKLNSPNDLWIDPKGGIYFTDPRYGKETDLEQGGFFVYYISPNGKPMIRVVDDLTKPNGIIGTGDGKKLYVADEGGGKIYAYDIEKDGTLKNKKLFADQGSDGMTIDEKGNVYLTLGGVAIFDPSGKKLQTIPVPEEPANVTFWGPQRDSLFITARTSIYSVKMNVKGQ